MAIAFRDIVQDCIDCSVGPVLGILTSQARFSVPSLVVSCTKFVCVVLHAAHGPSSCVDIALSSTLLRTAANQHGYRLSFARVSHHAHNFYCSGRGECKCNGCLVPKPSAGPNAPPVRRICPSAAPNAHIPCFYGAPNDRSTCTYVHLASVVIRQLGPAIICDIPV